MIFFSERAFFIELLETSEQTSTKETPFIGDARGDAPPQLALDRLIDDPALDSDEFDMDSGMDSGMDDLRLDDLDPDMFDTGMPEDF